MPVNATIPLTQDFLQTTGTYPLLTELIQHPTNGYLYGCYTEAGIGKILKLKNDNYSDVTVANLPVTAPIDMHYSATNDRFYVVYRTTNSPVTEVHPTTLAMASFFSITSVGGQGAITGDTANLYVATFSTQKLYSISLATGLQVGLRTMPATGYAKINCLRYFSPKLYALSMDVDYVQLSRIATANLGTEEVSAPIGIDVGEVPVDDMGESSGHIYVGNRDLLGIIRKFSKTDFLNPELIETAQLSKCTCVKTVGGFIWAAFENGRGVRINPTNIPDRRTYTLNDGEGYHSEFTGLGNEFVHTYNLSTGKIQRYHIPSDVVPGQINWLNYTAPGTGIAHCHAVAVYSDGSVFAVGQYGGTIDFRMGKGGSAVNPSKTSVGGWDIFVAKYTSAGVLSWVKSFGNTNTDIATAVVVDSLGNPVVSGFFNQPSINFGGGDLNCVGSAQFVAKLSGVNGDHVWSTAFAGSTQPGEGGSSLGRGLAIHTDDSLVSVGDFSGKIVCGAIPTLTSAGSQDIFLVKLSSAGVVQWARPRGGTAFDAANGIALDSSGNPVIVGYFSNPTNLGSGNISGDANKNVFVAKYSGVNGDYVWHKIAGTTGDNIGYAVAVDRASGRVAITGGFQGTIDFGGNIINTFLDGGVFLAIYESNSDHFFSKGYGARNSEGHSIAIDANSNLVFTGKITSSSDFSGTGVFISAKGYFIASYRNLNVYRWALGCSGNGAADGKGIALGPNQVVASGSLTSTINFGTVQNPFNASAGLADPSAFLIQYVN